MLTRKQYELLRFHQRTSEEFGVPPSFDEMKDALDLRSKSGIHRARSCAARREGRLQPPPSTPAIAGAHGRLTPRGLTASTAKPRLVRRSAIAP